MVEIQLSGREWRLARVSTSANDHGVFNVTLAPTRGLLSFLVDEDTWRWPHLSTLGGISRINA